MKKETKVVALILSLAVVLSVAVSGWIIFSPGNEQSLVTPTPPSETPPEESPESQAADFDISKYEIKGNVPNAVKPLEEDKTTSVTITEDEDGNQTVVNDWSKPEEPEKPSIEDEGQLTDPDKKPEYTPEEVTPAPTEPKDTTPKGGEQNNSGQVYVPGFGWLTPSKDSGHVVEGMYENGNKVGIM